MAENNEQQQNNENKINDKLNLTSWGFPQPIINYYFRKGITQFFPWQVECLQLPGIIDEQKNLVYSAPTSAGKTMVSDVLLFKTVLERRKKVIVVLPFVSISEEKVHSLKYLCRRLGIRIDSFAGDKNPRGGFKRVDIAVCTIEKASGIINKLIEEKKISDLGLIIVDELHMISNSKRGHILELILMKIIYLKKKYNINLQIVGMSATIPNLIDIAEWLDARLYITDYRPVDLNEYVVVGKHIMSVKLIPDSSNSSLNCSLIPQRQINPKSIGIETKEYEALSFLTFETLFQNYSVLIFCPTKNYCEKLAFELAKLILKFRKFKNTSDLHKKYCDYFEDFFKQKEEKIKSLLNTLKRSSAGLDKQLYFCTELAISYHHAGLVKEQRAALEQGFRDGTIRVLCSTTTLSAGVNLPARRVLIATPFDYTGQELIAVSDYRQMIGRAGRQGIDTLGESFIFCLPKEVEKVRTLLSSDLYPVRSSLTVFANINNAFEYFNTNSPWLNEESKSSCNILIRTLLEVISNGMIDCFLDLLEYFNCTFLACNSTDKKLLKNNQQDGNIQQLFRSSIEQTLKKMLESFLLSIRYDSTSTNTVADKTPIKEMKFENDTKLAATPLGAAVIASSISPTDAAFISEELKKCSKNLSLSNDLHLVYEITPIFIVKSLKIDWNKYYNIFKQLDENKKHVANLVGVEEQFLFKMTWSSDLISQNSEVLIVHKRFFASLALYDLIQEVPMDLIQKKYDLNKGLLQSLQLQSSTFAGMLSTFCNRMGWSTMELLIENFQPRLSYGVQRDLIDLMRLPCITSSVARLLYKKGFDTVVSLIHCKPRDIAIALVSSDSPLIDQEDRIKYSNEVVLFRLEIYVSAVNKFLTIEEYSKMIIQDARILVENDIGQKIQFDSDTPLSSSDGQPSTPIIEDLIPEENPKSDDHQSDTSSTEKQSTTLESTNESIQGLPLKRVKTESSSIVPSEEKTKEITTINNQRSSTPIKNTDSSQKDKNIIDKPKSNDTFSFSTMSFDDESLMEEVCADFERKQAELALAKSSTNEDANKNQDELANSMSLSTMSLDYYDECSLINNDNKKEDKEIFLEGKKEKQCIEKESISDLDEDSLQGSIKNSNLGNKFVQNSIVGASEVDKLEDALHSESIKDPSGNLFGQKLLEKGLDNFTTGTNFVLTHVKLVNCCKKMLSQLYDENTLKPLKFSLYFHLKKLSTRCMIALQSKPHSSKIIKLTRNENEYYLPLKSSQDFGVYEVFIKKFEHNQIYWIYGDEALNYLRQNWFEYTKRFHSKIEENEKNKSNQKEELFKQFLFTTYDLKTSLRCLYEAFEFDRQFLFKKIDWLDVTTAFWLLNSDQKPIDFKNLNLKQIKELMETNLLDVLHTPSLWNLKKIQQNPSEMSKRLNEDEFSRVMKTLILNNLMFNCLKKLNHLELLNSYLLIEIPSRVCLFIMETNDIPVDKNHLKNLEDSLYQYMNNIEMKVFNAVGQNFNINSDNQVAEILYNRCNLMSNYFNVSSKLKPSSSPSFKTNNKNNRKKKIPLRFSTSKYALKKLQEACGERIQLPTMIIEWRKLNHAMANAIQTIRENLYFQNNDTNGSASIYPRCCEWTGIGRITMSKPNLICVNRDFELTTAHSESSSSQSEQLSQQQQQDSSFLATQTPISIKIRKLLHAPENYRLIAADYCQLEFRILAHLSRDQNLIELLKDSNKDVFKLIASNWKSIPYDEIDLVSRQQVKQICYGIIYGMGNSSLADKLDITVEEAAELKRTFFQHFPKLAEFIEECIDQCKKDGYAKTILNRRRNIPHINNPDHPEHMHSCRQAVHTKISGSAADLFKISIIIVQKKIFEMKFDARLIMQMHDELMYIVHIDHCSEFIKFLKQKMEDLSKLVCVSMPVKVSIGQNWSDLEEIDADNIDDDEFDIKSRSHISESDLESN